MSGKVYRGVSREQWCVTDVEQVSDTEWRHTCIKCKRVVVVHRPKMARQCPEYYRGMGTFIARWLKFFGVTPERISKIIGKPCKCPKRREDLDRLDFALRRKIKRFGLKLHDISGRTPD